MRERSTGRLFRSLDVADVPARLPNAPAAVEMAGPAFLLTA